MNKPVLSVIMPVYNAEPYVAEAIQSILNQTFKDFEIVIINDGSDDSSKIIIKSFNDSRINYFENAQNKGIAFSRNRGLELSRGEFIGMLDADDIAYPSRFEKQITFLRRNKDYGMIGSWVTFIDENSKKLPGGWKLKAKPEEIPSIMLFNNYFTQSSVLIRKQSLNNINYVSGFDIGEDYLMWLEISKKTKVWNLQEYLVMYRVHTKSITQSNKLIKNQFEKSIFKAELVKIGIEATEKELELHMKIKSNNAINNIKDLVSIERWLLKIMKNNNELELYNTKILNKVILNRWLKVCYKSNLFNLRILIKFVSSKILVSKLTNH